jgi:hypothetical protein
MLEWATFERERQTGQLSSVSDRLKQGGSLLLNPDAVFYTDCYCTTKGKRIPEGFHNLDAFLLETTALCVLHSWIRIFKI